MFFFVPSVIYKKRELGESLHVRENYQCILLLNIATFFSPCLMRVSEQHIELNILSATTTLKSRCNTAPLPPGSMLVEQTGARVVIASIAFLNNIAWEGEGGRCLARQVFQHFEGNCMNVTRCKFLATFKYYREGSRVVACCFSVIGSVSLRNRVHAQFVRWPLYKNRVHVQFVRWPLYKK